MSAYVVFDRAERTFYVTGGCPIRSHGGVEFVGYTANVREAYGGTSVSILGVEPIARNLPGCDTTFFEMPRTWAMSPDERHALPNISEAG